MIAADVSREAPGTPPTDHEETRPGAGSSADTDIGSRGCSAKWSAIGVGTASILMGLLTNHESGIVRVVPMHVHLVGDALAGTFLAVSPWLFGFSDHSANVWVPHLVVGIASVALAATTTPWPARRDLARREEDVFGQAARA